MSVQSNNRKILIIGGAGYVGTALGDLLADKKESFAVYDNFSHSKELKDLSHVPVYRADIRDIHELEKAFVDFKPTHVILLAALHFIPYCVEHPEEVVGINVVGVQNVIDTIRKLDPSIELIFSSSAAVYKDSDGALSENSDLEQIDIYGLTKALDERLIKAQCEYYKIVRLFNVYGNHDPHPHVIPRIYEELKSGKPNLVMGSVAAKRDYVHVDEVASAIYHVLTKGKNQNVYNVGTGETLSVEEMIEKLMSVVGHRPVLTPNSEKYARRTDRMVLKADISKITEHTGWRPKVSISEGLETLK
jgi:UDP-glucose 4-epimerase